MMRMVAAAVLVLTGCDGTPAPVPTPSPTPNGAASAALARDLRAYATASCLIAQDQPYLRQQGERWAGGVMQRASGAIEVWSTIGDAVRAELKSSGIGQGYPEGPNAPDVPLPVMTCGEIADTPLVAAALARAGKALAADYQAAARAEQVFADAFLPQVYGAKRQVTLRLKLNVIDRFRKGGPGWQGRINEALRRALGL